MHNQTVRTVVFTLAVMFVTATTLILADVSSASQGLGQGVGAEQGRTFIQDPDAVPASERPGSNLSLQDFGAGVGAEQGRTFIQDPDAVPAS